MMTIKQLERWAAAGLFLAALMAVPSFARAQNTADNDTTRQELRTFDQFLDNHPQIANDLKKHPALVNDAGFVRQHRELGDFLRDHPRVREELKENPGAFMNRERGLERTEAPDRDKPDNDTTRAELGSFDQFLDSHPAVAKDLKQNPNLINNPQYLSKHPGLKDYLQDHPRVREEVKENPGAFMSRERGLEGKEEKTEGKKHRKHQRNDRDRDRN
ncbi:MAG: hypothetical protein DMG84_15635 [Acidobacteria bacterium]|jgi:hypothetical protein|nr:MAG: hypothetical protein AUI17_03335 [Acidobacteriales bacterium 13_2_20CM_2_55_5]PYX09702.1 MAG: hypothetical protein DMG85_09090 [Acidobacteriota bacterium]PYX14337.1 MAG: hypothetical protein DMG84_15635 [Acidobacteriota bacterium]